MRIWADVYDTDGVKVAQIHTLISMSTASKLDEAGTFDLQCGLDADVISYLISGNEVALMAQEDTETPLQWMRGKIVKPRNQETADNVSISRSGRDQINELNFRTVGLGRAYNAQTVQTIADDLVELVPDWTADVETASASLLKTARYDGSKVLRAIAQSCKQWGLHFRLGTDSRTLEIGEFGTAATTDSGQAIWAMQSASSFGIELYANDAVLVIESISVTEDADPILNWAIPMGAGEGTAATTLKDTSYQILDDSDNTVYRAGTTPTYPIYIRSNDFGIDEYYVDASDGDELRQDTLSFKNIGPIANSSTAKTLASDALADATFQSLARTREALTSYTLSVKKMRVTVQPGDLIHVQYKGIVPTMGGSFTYIDVDEDLWVMGVQHSASDSGFTHTLQVSTIDRHVMDETDLLVEVLDRTEVRNIAPGTDTFWSENTYNDYVCYNTLSGARYANFKLQVDDEVLEILKVQIRFKTYPLQVFSHGTAINPIAGANIDNLFTILQGNHHPKGLQLWVNGVDVSASYGGPWNPLAADNTALDVSCDISQLILDAGIYNEHTIQFRASVTNTSTTYSVPGYGTTGAFTGEKSSGQVELNIRLRGLARPI